MILSPTPARTVAIIKRNKSREPENLFPVRLPKNCRTSFEGAAAFYCMELMESIAVSASRRMAFAAFLVCL